MHGNGTIHPRHLEYPRLRRVEAIAVRHEGRDAFVIHDAAHLVVEAYVVSPGALQVAAYFDGEMSVTELAAGIKVDEAVVRGLVGTLDEARLLHGPRFDEYHDGLRREFEQMRRMPARATADVTVEGIEEALAVANGIELGSDVARVIAAAKEARIVGMVAPHLDFERGKGTYAAAWRIAPMLGRFDRVVVMGTNHFGSGTGVTLSEKGYETAAGPLEADEELTRAIAVRLGPAVSANSLDHVREHSVEQQMPWIRHVLGERPVTGLLVHDPTVNGGASYDGEGVGLDEFVGAMRELLEGSPGRTLLVASADLSHVGPQFGDDSENTAESLAAVEARDRAHLERLARGDVEGFVEAMTAEGNSTRWCTIGAMAALWRVIERPRAALVKYEQSGDDEQAGPRAITCVTTAAMVVAPGAVGSREEIESDSRSAGGRS